MPSVYNKNFDRENCGYGLMANMDGKPSHWLVHTAIQALSRLKHRGAVDADGKTGDGCGILVKKPDGFLRAVCHEQGIEPNELYAAGMVFLNRDDGLAARVRHRLETELKAEGFEVAGWRTVPPDTQVCGMCNYQIDREASLLSGTCPEINRQDR